MAACLFCYYGPKSVNMEMTRLRQIYTLTFFLCVSHFSITAHLPSSSSTGYGPVALQSTTTWSQIYNFFVFVADLTLWLWWHFETSHQQSSFFKMTFFWFLIRKIFVSKTLKCSWLWRDELEHQALHPTAWLHTVHTDVPLSLSVLANERPQNVLEKTLNNQKQL